MAENGLKEFPLITASIFGCKLPVATTSYFRLLPYAVSDWAVRRLNRQGITATLNFHSWEFDAEQPRIKLPFPHGLKHYYGLQKTKEKLAMMLRDANFLSCMDLLIRDDLFMGG